MKITKLAINSFARKWQMQQPALQELVNRINSTDFSALVSSPLKPGEPEDFGYEIKNGVARINIVGVITDTETVFDDWFGFCPAETTIAAINKADADPQVNSIELYIDSPGGFAQAGGMVAQVVATCKKDITARGGGLVASAAYRIASQCDSISAYRDSMIGCIGTYTVLCDTTGMQDQVGMRLILVSSGGVKGAGADGNVTSEYAADVDREVQELNDLFVTDVAKGRGLKQPRARELADGRAHIASSAKSLGLIDSIEVFKTKENKTMNEQQFSAFAESNPDSPVVKDIHAKGHKAGKADGATESQTQERQRVLALFTAFPGRNGFVKSQVEKGATVESAKADFADVLSAENADLKIQLAAKPAQVQVDAGGSPAIPLAVAATPAAAVAKPEGDAKATAAWEWDNEADKRGSFTSKAQYVAIRHRELTGQVRTVVAPKSE